MQIGHASCGCRVILIEGEQVRWAKCKSGHAMSLEHWWDAMVGAGSVLMHGKAERATCPDVRCRKVAADLELAAQESQGGA